MSVQLWKLLKRKKFSLKGTQWTVIGYSRCARNTFLYIPELNIAFDAGLATDVYPTHIFVTHAHMDHIGELFRYVIDPPNKLIPNVYIPRPSKEYVDEYIQGAVHQPNGETVAQFLGGTMNVEKFVETSIHMTKHNDKIKVPWNPVYVSIPKDHPEDKPVYARNLKIKNYKFKHEIFKCTHTIATTGHGLIECRSGLKPEYKHLKGNQEAIDALKAQGIDVTCEYEYPHFCFLGDTDHRVLYESGGGWNRHLEKYSTIIMECTFLEDADAKQAKDKKHALLSRILPFIRAHSNINFMLCHFSMKYKDAEVLDFFERLGCPNIIPIVHDFDALETDATVDLIKAENEYSISSVINALVQLGYSVQPPSKSEILTKSIPLCEECSNIHEECSCSGACMFRSKFCTDCSLSVTDCTCYVEYFCEVCTLKMDECHCKAIKNSEV